jgi:membrane fusion protein (multidrug efflux system)
MSEATEETIERASPSGKRKRLLLAVVGAFASAGIAYGAYWVAAGRYVESTEDAYVNGNVVQITSQVAGTVVGIDADDTQDVTAGQTLVALDRVDANVALERAEADLAECVREVRGVFARADELRSEMAAREVDLAKAKKDLARRENLAESGAVSTEEVQHARDGVRGAESALAAAREQLAGHRALVDDTSVASHPKVARAAAAVRAAYLDYRRADIPAPVSGVVAKRSVQLGQRVSPGTPLMAIVPPDQVWVDANFKEGQLKRIRAGQSARLTADANDVEYRGIVVGVGAGTGAAFALLPAQNATGNWIKVVQRLPVRIALDAQQVAAHPLAVGLSMEVRIDVHAASDDAAGDARVGALETDDRTTVFADRERAVDTLIADIIRENGGGRVVAKESSGRAPEERIAADDRRRLAN